MIGSLVKGDTIFSPIMAVVEDLKLLAEQGMGDTIFSPIMAVVEDLKLLAEQGMEGMSDRENSFR